MNDEIFKELSKNNMGTLDLDIDFFSNEGEWTLRTYEACKRIASSVDAEFIVLQNYNFNAAAFFKPRFISMNFGVFELSNKISFAITNFYLNDIKCDLSPIKNEDNKVYYDVFSKMEDSFAQDNKHLFENDSYKQTFELISSIFILFTMFHEAGHIYHRHGARHNLATHDADGASASKTLSDEEALASQTREVICDLFAFDKMIDNQLMEVKKICGEDRKTYISYISQYILFIGLYFYFLSPHLSIKNYKQSSHPTSALRMKTILISFFGNESLGLTKQEKEKVFSRFQHKLQDVLYNIFSDKAHYHWLFVIPDAEVKEWYEKIYAQIPKWYLYGIDLEQ
jgi:hypothetical protein